ncbi:MAG TPA: HepT-like ribonuclease domain-containing protein [Anaerolineae bacterium]|jgi:uncharacterized protein with HEPN domain
MSAPDPMVALRQMLEYAQEAVELCRSKERSDLDQDRLLELALVRLLEIIGEAANRVSPAEQAIHRPRYFVVQSGKHDFILKRKPD